LKRAVDENEQAYFQGISEALQKAETIHVMTKEDRDAAQEARARAQRGGAGASADTRAALVLSAAAEGVSIEEYLVSRGATAEGVAREIEAFGQDARTWLEPKNVSRRQLRAERRAADVIKAQELKRLRRGNQGG
jgi:hypothetical protein